MNERAIAKKKGVQNARKKLKRAFLGTAAGLALTAVPALASAETLGQALADAYNYSGLLKQERATLQAADEDAAQSKSALRPVLTWAAGMERDFGKTFTDDVESGTASDAASATLSMSLLLYDFGASKAAIEAAKETVLLTRQELVDVEQSVLLTAVTAYMNVREASETLSVQQANLNLLQQELKAAQDKFSVGEVTRTDVAQAQAALASARSSLISAQGTLVQAKLAYKTAIGHEPGKLVAPSKLPSAPKSIDDATKVALTKHPDMLVARKQVSIAQLQVKEADAALKPELSLSSSYGYDKSLDEGETYSRTGTISLGLSGTIYQGGALASAQRQALVNHQATIANLHVVTDTVTEDVADAYSDVETTNAAVSAGAEQVKAAEVAFEGVREEARLGSQTTLDVLTQEQDLLDARTDYISAQADQVVARYTMLESMGLLTAANLKLNVKIYDPEAYYNMVKDAPAGLSRQGRQLDSLLRSIGK